MIRKTSLNKHFSLRECIIISFLLFAVALSIRLVNFNAMGRTWDEPAYVETAYKYIQLLKQNNFSDPFWYEQSDHPPLARYLFAAVSSFDIKNFDVKGQPVYYYNYTFARLISTILSCISVIFVFLIGYIFFNKFIGIISALVFSLIPFFIGFAHTATLEALIMFTYTGSLFFFLMYLEKRSRIFLALTGFFTGLAMLTKLTNIYVFVTIIIVYLFFNFSSFRDFKIKKVLIDTGIIGVICFLTTFVLWPMGWFHLKDVWAVQETMRFSANTSIPEVFFGRLLLVPVIYYPIMFLITTPLMLILLGIIGMLKVDKSRNWVGIAIIFWFIIPFSQTFYHMRQHGVRYIIEIYAPFALLCGLGFEYFVTRFTNTTILKSLMFLPILGYLLLIFVRISPYYLDYFNEVVGGNNYVYSKRLFQMGWWGQGIYEAATYISSHSSRHVTVALNGSQPMLVMPFYNNLTVVDYKKYHNADYVIVPYFDIVRLGFDERNLSADYRVVYIVHVDKAGLVKVYKRNPVVE